jgi:hypothetical protein
MEEKVFFDQIAEIMQQPPVERHKALSKLHTTALYAYLTALRTIGSAQAEQRVHSGTETRTLIQVVGHMAAWDRFGILAAGDILADITHPRVVTSVSGYVEPDGQTLNFATVDEFNAYHAAQHATWLWEPMRTWAAEMATTLHALFTQPNLLSAARLEQTLPHRKRLVDDVYLENSTMGWSLWLIVLEHLAVEHAPELGIKQLDH